VLGFVVFSSQAKAEKDTGLSVNSIVVSQPPAPYGVTWKGTIYINSQDTVGQGPFYGTVSVNGIRHLASFIIQPDIAPGVQSSFTVTAGGFPASTIVDYKFGIAYTHNGQMMAQELAGSVITGP
jgi:hypothetical protein